MDFSIVPIETPGIGRIPLLIHDISGANLHLRHRMAEGKLIVRTKKNDPDLRQLISREVFLWELQKARDDYSGGGWTVSKRHDRTAMGGDKEAFQTTCWTQIAAAGTENEDVQRRILEALFKSYWKPVYCYLRRKGDDNEKAKDLTQGFFYEILLGGKFLTQVDRTQGRFRTYLLTALNHYRTNVHHKMMARRRRPDGDLFSLTEYDTPENLHLPVTATPEDVFTYAWACDVLDEVISQVRQETIRDGKEIHWNVFRDRVLLPILENCEIEGLDSICTRYGIESHVVASNMIVTIKRRFHSVLKRCVCESLGTQISVEDELKELLAIFSRHRAG